MQPPANPLSDLGFVHQTIRKLPVAPGRPTGAIQEVLADLTSQEWEMLKTWEIPDKHKTYYAASILRELSKWTTGKDREGNRTTNPPSHYHPLLELVEQLKSDMPHVRYAIWHETFKRPPLNQSIANSAMESLRTALYSLGPEAYAHLKATANPITLQHSRLRNGAQYVADEYVDGKRPNDYRKLLAIMFNIALFCLKTLRQHEGYFYKLVLNDIMTAHNHVNYLHILELLHSIGELDSYSDLLLSTKLTIATLKPRDVDLFYKTPFADGQNCGERLKEELKELAEHVQHRNDDMVRYDLDAVRNLGETALPGSEWHEHWDLWGRRLGLASEFLYYEYTPSPGAESPFFPGNRNYYQ